MKAFQNRLHHGADITPGTEWLCGLNVPNQEDFHGRAKFGRLFQNLPGYTFHPDFLNDLGEKDGIMEASPKNPSSTTIPAGFTFLGQFIDHDITLDTTSRLERRNDPNMLTNFRTPSLELDNVYGSGREASPFLYKKGSDKLLLAPGGQDLQRNADGTALIGDPRNDENFFVGHLQLAFIKFHNATVIKLNSKKEFYKEASERHGITDVLELAQRLVRWHYQWIVVHEYLPFIIGQNLVNNILGNKPQFYKPFACGGHSHDKLNPYMPVEFSVAAYRFGHSQVTTELKDANGVSRPLFGDNAFSQGFSPLDADEDIQIDWSQLFEIDSSKPQMAGRIDTKLAPALMELPFASPPTSLAQRNLLRGNALGLPTGEAVADRMGEDVLSIDELGSEIKELFEKYKMPTKTGETATPLWYYILQEANVKGSGETLGPVGGRIVGEVMLGLLMYDPQSYLSRDPNWTPELDPTQSGDFTMEKLLKMAKVLED